MSLNTMFPLIVISSAEASGIAWTTRTCALSLPPQLASMLSAVRANVRVKAFKKRNMYILQKAGLVVSKDMGCMYRSPRFCPPV